VRGKVLLYADRETDSIRNAVGETERRRERQRAYNVEHSITPESITSGIASLSDSLYERDYVTVDAVADADLEADDLADRVDGMRAEMRTAAKELDFERAALVRDQINAIEERALLHGFEAKPGARRRSRGRGRRRR
jgi:excinuclease ABC subunit B